ncbi:MAG: hypothetical protein AAF513_20220 [Pseudomonadota bacterium]
MNLDWPLVALIQMALISLSVGIGLGLAVRGLRRQNTQMREHIASQPDEAFWQTQVDGLTGDGVEVGVEKLVFKQRIEPHKDYADALAKLLETPDEGCTAEAHTALEGKVADLEAQLEQARTEQQNSSQTISDQTRGLLQQFTKDSRDLMNCIATLQAENADLKAQLESGPTTQAAEASPSAEEASEPPPRAHDNTASDAAAPDAAPAEDHDPTPAPEIPENAEEETDHTDDTHAQTEDAPAAAAPAAPEVASKVSATAHEPQAGATDAPGALDENDVPTLNDSVGANGEPDPTFDGDEIDELLAHPPKAPAAAERAGT